MVKLILIGLMLVGCTGNVSESVSSCSNWVTYKVPVNHCLFAESDKASISDEVNDSCAEPKQLFKNMAAYTVAPVNINSVKVYCSDLAECRVRVVSPEEDIDCAESIGSAIAVAH